MESDFEMLKKWQDMETEQDKDTNTDAEEVSLKRQRDTPSKTPRATKKQRPRPTPTQPASTSLASGSASSQTWARPSTEMPLRQSVLEICSKEPTWTVKHLSRGDRLTEGNSRNIQWAFADGDTKEDRLEGLTFKFEDWHAIRNLFEDAVKEGDGERLLRLYSVAFLLYKTYGHHQYAYSTFLLTVQVNATLSPSLAHSIKWNRFWNGQGGQGRNIPLDLHLEHLNNFLKSFLKRSGPNITEQAANRVSKALGVLKVMMEITDRELGVTKSGIHQSPSLTDDVACLVHILTEAKVFQNIPGENLLLFLNSRGTFLQKRHTQSCGDG
ncbi:hypothetical protein WMY93_010365 [Mugilogobius chulae]|uniref:DUF6589 domain-containing protein n=1 Tax=Mugilogobius chulae TaxID=88201 RepID=A0AAW0PCU4_9GOBI